MKNYFNKLRDDVVIINDKGSIVFANNFFLDRVANKNKEVDLNKINNIVKIKNNEIFIMFNNEIIKKGVCKFSNINWYGEEVQALSVCWETQEKKFHKEILLEKAIDKLSRWICIRDINNNYVYVNKTCADYYKTTKAEACKILTQEIKSGRFKEDFTKEDEYILKMKSNCSYEIKVEIDGIEEYYYVKKCPILNEKGEVEYIAESIQDISLNKSVQSQILDGIKFNEGNQNNGELKVEEIDESIFESFKTHFERNFDCDYFNIWLYDKNSGSVKPYFDLELVEEKNQIGKFKITDEIINKYINGNFETILKLTDKEHKQIRKNEIVYLVNYPIINQGDFKGIVTLRYSDYPAAHVFENNFMETLCNKIGFLIKSIEFSRRINEELNYRAKLENDLEMYLDISTDFVVKTDLEGNFKYVSRGVVNVLGWTKEDILNMKWREIIHPDEIESTENIIKNPENLKQKFNMTNRYRCADGAYKWLSWTGGGYLEAEDCILGSAKDVTREMELELKEKQFEKARQLEEVKNEFFANISHEFRTPITMIMTTNQMMEKYVKRNILNKNIIDEKIIKDPMRYITILKQNGYRLLKLVNNLIDITKIDSGFYKIKPININVIYVIEEIVLSVVEYCKGNRIKLIFDTEVEEEVIACDPDQIERIMLNLLSNAIKYTPVNGEIMVNINLENDYLNVKVQDTGRGISKEKLEVIFERFVQGENTLTRTSEGSGIGLSLVKGLVEMHGGSISAESEEGIGSTFEFKLPRRTIELDTINPVAPIEVKQSKIEKCSIEFADIYNL